MLTQKDQLTELVRELESLNHIFATDPLLITEKLKDEPADPLEKLHRRAKRIDSNGKLANTLQKIDSRIKAIILLLSFLWSVSGFLGLFALLNANVVNFFYVLICLLGFHTLMLVGWIIFTIISDKNKPTLFASLVSPSHLIRGKDDVTLSAVKLYQRQLQHSGMRWYLGTISHQLWLATLCGMLLALIVLLMVRDFTFSWESTLLSADTVAIMVSGLAWLPDLVGFPTPSPEQVLQSQQFASNSALLTTGASRELSAKVISSYEWAMLLIGSLLMYGVVPRLIVWVMCLLLFHSKKMSIDLTLPYYQKILDFWSRKVVDEDDFVEKLDTKKDSNTSKNLPQVAMIDGKKLAVLLEYPHENQRWYFPVSTDDKSTTDQDGNTEQLIEYDGFENYGIVDDREDIDKLIEYLQSHKVQVILGVHSTALPDRGTLRKLDKIAKHAKYGMLVQLLADSNSNQPQSPQQSQRLQQWEQALMERGIGMING